MSTSEGLIFFDEAVHADDDCVTTFNIELCLVGSVLNLALWISFFDGGHHAAHPVDDLDVLKGRFASRVGHMFDGVAAREGVDKVGDSAFLRDDLLGPSASRAASGVGSPGASSRPLVCKLWVPPITGLGFQYNPDTLLSTCCAVRVPVWV